MKTSNTPSSNGSAATQQKSNGKAASMKSSQLMELFVNGLKDIYWAENALIKAMPKMIKKASSDTLKDALHAHVEETKEHVKRLEQIFMKIEVKAEGIKCDAMEGLTKEANVIMESSEAGSMLDAGIISAVQKLEHYEIATYGTLRQFAVTLKLNEVASLLETTLQEEKEADLKLSAIAMDTINVDAAEQEA